MAVSESSFIRRVGIAIALVVLAAGVCALLAAHPEVVLLVFAGVLAAIFLDALARPLMQRGLPRGGSIAAVVTALAVATSLGVVFAGQRVADQIGQLGERLPGVITSAERTLSQTALGREAMEAVNPTDSPSPPDWKQIAPFVFGSVAQIFSTSLGVAAGAIAVLALAIFFALQPDEYVRGVLYLFPAERRRRLREVLAAAAHSLRRWMVGRFTAMALVALLTAIGLTLLGVELALVLGLIAGVFTFVPYVGPIAAAVPAVLLTLASGGLTMALWVTALYVAVQLIEDYLFTPLVQGRAVSLPPATLIVAQALMGALLGVLGLVLATPLLVVAIVFVQALYVNDVLGENVRLIGTHERGHVRSSRLSRFARSWR